MKKISDTTADAAGLRADAEASLKNKPAHMRMPRSDADVRKQLHELQVSQIKLEMQNCALTELQQAKMEIEAGLARYTDLYDFAPAGYFTLDRDSTLSEINLTGAKQLGLVRSKLIGQRFSAFVAAESQPALQTFLNRVFASDAKQDCEVTLLTAHHRPLHVHIGANADASGRTCRAIMEDISERKAMTAELHKAHAELEAKVQARTAELMRANARLKVQIAERKRKSWGIAGMVERARYFGGDIRITDTSHGTLMVLRMPLENPVNGQESRRTGQ